MEITETRIFPKQGQDKKLQAYATITFDHKFVVRNIKVIQGASGLFIAMPSRKAKGSCQNCGFKNEVGSKFCNQCGKGMSPIHKDEGQVVDPKTDHRDIAHPITQEFRDYLQSKILEAYHQEKASGGKSVAIDEDI